MQQHSAAQACLTALLGCGTSTGVMWTAGVLVLLRCGLPSAECWRSPTRGILFCIARKRQPTPAHGIIRMPSLLRLVKQRPRQAQMLGTGVVRWLADDQAMSSRCAVARQPGVFSSALWKLQLTPAQGIVQITSLLCLVGKATSQASTDALHRCREMACG
jgi:hypothetical protein